MKRSLIFAISLMSAIGITSPAFAESSIAINSQNANKVLTITPFNLVQAGYQGRFVNQGIPSAGRFRDSIRTNRIKAEDLIKVAIAEGRLSPDTLQNKSYIRNVESALNGLDRN